MKFISENFPQYTVHPVPRDGLCILNSFLVNLRTINKNETVESIKSVLKEELQKEIYRNVVGDISEEVEQFFTNPLRNYSNEYVDVFLEALSMAFEVNIVIFQSNVSYCEIINNINRDNNFQHTLYFLRTESMHFDPVIPPETSSSVEEELFDKNVEQDEESDDSVTIVEDFNKKETDVLKMAGGGGGHSRRNVKEV